MKIAVYTITKNEEQFIKRWAESCAEADYRLIVDTGSTDNTVQVAEDNGCHVAKVSIIPWRFDDARNAALSLVPSDIDFCIALDADEILMPGWRQELEKLSPGVTRPRYKYVWSWNADGSEGLSYSGDKIHARKHYRWKHPVHEVIICTGTEVPAWTNLQIHHHPDHSKSRSQYLPLLELAIHEAPDDDRNRFYLGRELMFNNRPQEAAQHLLRHLELSNWRAERATAMRYLGRVTGEREHWLLRACAEAPDRREPWVELCQLYYEQRRWDACLSASLRAQSIIEKPLEYLCEAESWGPVPHDMAAIAAWNMGLKKVSVRQAEQALNLAPYDERLRSNYRLVSALSGETGIDVVIPTKSNAAGFTRLIEQVLKNDRVRHVAVITDGEHALTYVAPWATDHRVYIYTVEQGAGIHEMWNAGIGYGDSNNHCVFINDDVVIDEATLTTLGAQLDQRPEIGLLSPNYDGRQNMPSFVEVSGTCRGRYDGTGGIAGFCMMLSNQLRNIWRFDTRMKWWYGDDDLVQWVSSSRDKLACISGISTCSSNESWTINNDPPENFSETVLNDERIFRLKWGLGA